MLQGTWDHRRRDKALGDRHARAAPGHDRHAGLRSRGCMARRTVRGVTGTPARVRQACMARQRTIEVVEGPPALQHGGKQRRAAADAIGVRSGTPCAFIRRAMADRTSSGFCLPSERVSGTPRTPVAGRAGAARVRANRQLARMAPLHVSPKAAPHRHRHDPHLSGRDPSLTAGPACTPPREQLSTPAPDGGIRFGDCLRPQPGQATRPPHGAVPHAASPRAAKQYRSESWARSFTPRATDRRGWRCRPSRHRVRPQRQ